ncbi:MAG TPA: dipeptide epimerase, partial [Parasegetibacter sp.]
MKITNIEIFRFSIPMEPFTIATATMNAAENLLIHIQTDNPAISGWGEGSPFPAITGETQETCVAMARLFATAWMEQNPLEIERRIQQLHD